jgi:hypothetical protein
MLLLVWEGKNQTMDEAIRTYSGRSFNEEDLVLIRWVRKTYPKLSRSELAATICEILDWQTPGGTAKLPQCLSYLQMLEDRGLVELPALQKTQNKRKPVPKLDLAGEAIEADIRDIAPIQLRIAEDSKDRLRWRSYVDQYHQLGYRQVYGSRLQYFICSGERELGCLQYSASAWALEERDRWIGWTVEDRKARLHLIVNNSRCLIFPWVRIRNLASQSLALSSRQIPKDWLRYFCYAPVLLETFVDLEQYRGTSYKAANWICLGETKGRGRQDRHKEYGLSRKAIYLYPLQKDFRAVLLGEKICKQVLPE